MKKHQMVVAVCMLSVVVGCTGSSPDLLSPDGSYLANGYGFGSGNRISDTTSTTTATPMTETPANSRFDGGGYTIGSGS